VWNPPWNLPNKQKISASAGVGFNLKMQISMPQAMVVSEAPMWALGKID